MDKTTHADPEVAETTKKSWPLWKKLTIGGVAALIIIGLAVGLGVGLTANKPGKGDDDDSSSDETTSSNITISTDPPPFNTSLLWQPTSNTTWQIILSKGIAPLSSSSSSLTPNVSVYDLDLYDNDAATFAALKELGVKVICYFSAGSYENYRADKDEFEDKDLGKVMDGWPDEKWVNVSSPGIRKIMKERIRVAAEKGCDAIDPDNVDGYGNDNGLGLTESDAISFMHFLATEAASHNMSTGLKNAGAIIPAVLPYVAFSVNEQCIQYAECTTFAPFIAHGKPVFNIEYPDGAPKVDDKTREGICSREGKARGTEGFSTVIKKMALDGWVEYCDGGSFETKVKDGDGARSKSNSR